MVDIRGSDNPWQFPALGSIFATPATAALYALLPRLPRLSMPWLRLFRLKCLQFALFYGQIVCMCHCYACYECHIRRGDPRLPFFLPIFFRKETRGCSLGGGGHIPTTTPNICYPWLLKRYNADHGSPLLYADSSEPRTLKLVSLLRRPAPLFLAIAFLASAALCPISSLTPTN